MLQRFKDSMSLIMAVLYAADYDWKDWGRKTVISKQDSLKSMKNMTMNDNLVNSVLYTSCITTGEIDKKHMMVSDFFSTEYAYSRRGELNSSGCGCYLYHDEPNAKWYLLICWMQAVRVAAKAALAVKSNSSIYALKTIADRHESAIPDDEARVILDRLPEVQSYLKGIPTTLLDVTSYVFAEDARSARIVERARSKPATNNVTSIRSPH